MKVEINDFSCWGQLGGISNKVLLTYHFVGIR